jgi:hypothetical protein
MDSDAHLDHDATPETAHAARQEQTDAPLEEESRPGDLVLVDSHDVEDKPTFGSGMHPPLSPVDRVSAQELLVAPVPVEDEDPVDISVK